MATKSIITRIKNKVDSLSAWQSYTGTLLNGEIAVVRVPTGTSYTNPVTGKSEPVVELLMKVGDGETAFADLPWMSAKASDVYDWAKASTVEFNSTDNKIYFKKADGATISSVDLSAINAKIADKLSDITVTQSGSGVVKSVEKNGTGAVKVTRSTVATGEIADSAVTTAKIANSNVTTAKLADAAVTNAKLGTDISSDKINIGTSTTTGTLTAKLTSMDASIAANTAKLAGHTNDAINELITAKINTLDGGTDSGSAGSSKYVSKVVQTDGKVATTYTSFPTASTSAAGIAKLGATGGAATYDSIFGSDGKGGINAQVNTNKSDIASLKNAVAGGVHFIGTVTAKPTAASVTVNGSSTSTTASAGDVVIWAAEGREYIYTGSVWEELGDVDRIGALETKIDGLDVPETNAVSTTHKFVSQVTQENGQVAVTYTQPTSADVSHDGNTVKVALENIAANKANASDVYTKTETNAQITNAINDLDVSAPTVPTTGTTTATAFIDSISQANGKISATKKNLPNASTSATGIVKLSSATNNTSESLAATPKAVKAAYDLANTASTKATTIQSNYVRVDANNKLVHYIDGTDTEIIFDCGGAN